MRLYIGNKNYSSWSLRPWVLLRELGIPFEEKLLVFGDEAAWAPFRALSPASKVPCLVDGDLTIWDSFAITEYVAERHPRVWPSDVRARAWARSAAAEMHSSFGALRERCSMCCGLRIELASRPPELERDLARLRGLWEEGLSRFGGPFLAGEAFTAVDAFFAPVAFRAQTYGLKLGAVADEYAARLRALPSMVEWYEAGIAETWRDEPHEIDLRKAGRWVQDLRV